MTPRPMNATLAIPKNSFDLYWRCVTAGGAHKARHNNGYYFVGAGVAKGLPCSTTYVANIRAALEPELVALWTVPAGMWKVFPGPSVTSGFPSCAITTVPSKMYAISSPGCVCRPDEAPG